MAKDDDRLLKELYKEHREEERQEAPAFEAMMERAREQAESPAPVWRRRWPAVAAAAALALTTLGALVWSGPLGEPRESSEVAQSVAPVDQGESIAQGEVERWEELLEFADEVWVEEYPTDFLL